MRLLVTRPSRDAKKTAKRLEAAGHQFMVQPVMHIEFASQPAELIDPWAILITSRNAVRAMEKWPIIAQWRSRPVYAVGDATAHRARRVGFSNIRIGPGDGRGLSELVRTTVDPEAGPLLFPTSPDLPDLLPRRLSEAGFAVFVVPAYRRVAETALNEEVSAAFSDGRIDGVLLYSRRQAEVFAELAQKRGIAAQFGNVAFYVLAEQVAEPLKSLNPAEIRVAERRSEKSLLDLIPAPDNPP